jgi:hypothetical protein
MNTIPSFLVLTFFQEAYNPTPTPSMETTTTDFTPVYLFAFVLFVLFLIVVGVVIFLLVRRNKTQGEKKDDPQTIFTAPPKTESVPPISKPSPELPRSKPAQAPTAKSEVMPAIFISYRREDSIDVTGRIYDRLCQHFGRQNVFKDVDSIPLGVDFRKHLGDSVGQCNVLLTIIGRQWLNGERGHRRLDDVRDFVRIEMEAALKRDIPVVPVLVQGSSMPSLEDLPEVLQSLIYRNGIPVRPDPDFHQDMDRLIKGIEGYLKKSNG